MAPDDFSSQETQLLEQGTQLLGKHTQPLETPAFDTIQPPADEEQEALAALKALEERRAARRRSVLIKAGAAAGALALVVGGFFFARSALNKPKTNSPYEFAEVTRDDFKVSVQGSGALQPYAQVVVTPEVDGIIDTVNVSEGQQVKAGDVLFTLRNSEIDKSIADAEEAYSKAQAEVSKAYEALSKAEGERDTAKAKHDSAQAAADSARAQAQAAYDAAFNKIANPANNEFAEQERIYNDKKKEIDVDGKKKTYDEAAADCAEAKSIVDDAKLVLDDALYKQQHLPSDATPEERKEAQDRVDEANDMLRAANDNLADAERVLVDAESIYTDAANKMKPVDDKYSEAATAHQSALAAAASAGDAAKSRYAIPDVPSYDESSFDSSIESARSGITSAESSLKTAERALNTEKEKGEKRTVKAPKGGRIISFSAVVGASVGGASGGTTSSSKSTSSLATIADVSQMRVSLEINEIDITSVKAGQRATVTFASVPGLEQEARVVDVATVSSGSGESAGGASGVATFTVDCVIPKPDSRLKPGMTATITIYTTDLQNVLVVPAAALRELSDGIFVDVVDDPSELDKLTEDSPAPKTTRVKVKVLEQSSSQAVIESGLSEGDIVLVSGPGTTKSIDEMTQEDIDALSPEEIDALSSSLDE